MMMMMMIHEQAMKLFLYYTNSGNEQVQAWNGRPIVTAVS